jgi:hypothetical protein
VSGSGAVGGLRGALGPFEAAQHELGLGREQARGAVAVTASAGGIE